MTPSEDARMMLAIVHRHDDLALQVFAVEARYEEGPFPLPADRSTLLGAIERQLQRCELARDALEAQSDQRAAD
jgi:hypothetical protein